MLQPQIRETPADLATQHLQQLFNDGWDSDLEQFTACVADLNNSLLCDLVRLDQRERWYRSLHVSAEVYLRRFPTLGSDSELAADVVYNEFLLREQAGERPDLDEFLARFPHLADILGQQIRFHLAMLNATLDDRLADHESIHGDDTLGEGLPEFPGYEVLGMIAVGGMSIVYDAQQLGLNRRVAIKLISDSFLTKQSRQRFELEAQMIAKLDHANIVNVFDVGTIGGRPYLVLEYISGGTLSDHYRGLTVPHRDAAELIVTLARAIQHCHDRGVAHRDLAPANILLAPRDTAKVFNESGDTPPLSDWIPKVTDFGLSKFALEEPGHLRTRTGAVFGTPSYMAPEQASGKTVGLPLLVDIYSLGAILYELLTGRPPHQGATLLDALQQVISEQPIAPSRLTPSLPVAIETICLKCLEKEPSRRYATAAALADDLDRFLRGDVILARRAAILERGWRWCRRNPAVASLSGCVAALVVVTIAILAISNASIRRETAQKNEALTAKSLALNEKEQAYESLEESEMLAERRFYASQINLAGLAYQRGEITRAEDLLNSVVPRAGEPDFRGFEWNYLNAELHRGLVHTIKHPGNEILWLSFSHDGRRLLCAGGNQYTGMANLVDVLSGKSLCEVPKTKGGANACAYAPDGTLFAIGYSDGSAQVMRADSFARVHDEKTGLLIKSMAWSPDSTLLAVGCEAGELRVWRMPEFIGITLAKAHQGPILRIVFSRDSKRLYTSADWGGEGTMGRQWDAAKWPPESVRSYPKQSICDESPSGKTLISTNWGTIHVVDASDGRVMKDKRLSSGPIVTAKFTPDDTKILVASRTDRALRTLDAQSLDLLKVNPQTHTASALAIDPSGRYYAAGDSVGEVRIWDNEQVSYDSEYENPEIRSAFFVGETNRLVLSGSKLSLDWSLESEAITAIKQRGGIRDISLDGRTWVCVNPTVTTGVVEAVEVWRHGVDAPERIELHHPIYQNCLAVSATGRWLATRFDLEPIELYDLSQSPIRKVWSCESRCIDFAFSPDEKYLVAGQKYGSVGLIDVQSGKPLPNLAEFDSTWSWGMSVAFTRDSRVVASGNESGTVRVWETESRRLIATLTGQPGEVRSLAFFPDDRRLAVGGTGDVRIWDYRSGQELLALPCKGGLIESIAINPTGDTIVAVTPQGMAHAWVGRAPQAR